jgi:hypothetical protein
MGFVGVSVTVLAAWARQQAVTDIDTLDKTKVDKALKKSYSPYAGRTYPISPLYAGVIEIPTPRWTCYDAKRLGVKMDARIPMITQERAYTSPIWYTPGKQ